MMMSEVEKEKLNSMPMLMINEVCAVLPLNADQASQITSAKTLTICIILINM